MKKALITGISGQDGYFLTKLLLKKGYKVYGFARRNSQMTIGTLKFLPKEEQAKVEVIWGDIIDNVKVEKIIREIKPDEIYHLAAQSFVALSFEIPKATYDINIGGTLNVINAVKEFSPKTKVYFAATSELYGDAQETPQTEKTRFYPRSPYGISKLAGFWTIKNYRESYNLFATNGILFNHESEMRGTEFVTRKITKAIANIKLGKQKFVELGNLNAIRDWGYAGDYVEAMWLMLQQEKPDDFVIASGKNHSIREFAQAAFKAIDIEVEWVGKELDEVGKDKKTGEILIKVNPKFYRPADVECLQGDCSKAKKILGWEPKVSFEELVKIMVEWDLKEEAKN